MIFGFSCHLVLLGGLYKRASGEITASIESLKLLKLLKDKNIEDESAQDLEKIIKEDEFLYHLIAGVDVLVDGASPYKMAASIAKTYLTNNSLLKEEMPEIDLN